MFLIMYLISYLYLYYNSGVGNLLKIFLTIIQAQNSQLLYVSWPCLWNVTNYLCILYSNIQKKYINGNSIYKFFIYFYFFSYTVPPGQGCLSFLADHQGPAKNRFRWFFFFSLPKNQTDAASQMLTTCILLLQQQAFLNKVLQMLKIINDRKKKICFVFTFCKIFFVSTDKMLMQVEQFWCVQFESRTLRMEGKNKSISKETNTWNRNFKNVGQLFSGAHI